MSSFGTGTSTTGGSSIVLTAFSGTDGVQAGTDGLVPGPSINQNEYILGAGGDWTLNVKAIADLNDSSTRVATTDFVQTLIGNAQLGGGNANLSALGDTQFANLAADQFLQYNGNKWVNVEFTLDTISNVDLAGLQVGNTIVWDGNKWVPGVGGGGGANALNDLTDVSINGGDENHFLVRNAQGQYVNRLISTADLSNSDKVVLMDTDATFEAHNYDFTGATTITVPAPTADTHASTKKYVDDEVSGINLAGKQDADASLDTITGIADGDLLLGNGANSFEKISVDADVENFLKGTGSVGTLSDVNLANVVDGKILKYDNGSFVVADETDTNTQLTDNQVKDIVGQQMLGGTETGITVSYDAGNRNIDFAVSLGGFSIRDLSDVSGDALVNGKILKVDNGVLTQVDETDTNTQRTDAEIQTVVGGMVSNNTETGITVTAQNDGTLDFVVSLDSFSVDALSDVDTTTNPPNNGEVLKFDGNNFVPSADTGKTQAEIEDIVGGMIDGNTETGITVTYQPVDNTLDFEVDNTTVGFLAGVQTFDGDKTFTGAVDLTNATATGSTKNASDNSTNLATTAYVDAQIDTDIGALNLGATYQAKDSSLDDITGISDGDLLLGDGANSFEKVSVTAGAEAILKGSGSVDTLSDVSLQAGAVGDVLRVSAVGEIGGVANVPTSFVNTKLASSDLSDGSNVVLNNAGKTFGAVAYDFTASTVTVNDPTADAHASTKKYVDDELATKQPLEATLTGIANIAPVDNDLIIATGNDTFGVINTSAEVQTFLASDGSLDGIDNVLIAGNLGQALADGQTLRYDGANTVWKNSKLAFVDLDSNAASTQNVALLNSNQTFTGDKTFTGAVDLTGSTATAETVANNDQEGNSTRVATTAFVKTVVQQVGNVSDLADLTDVTLGGVAKAEGQVLQLSNDNSTFVNAVLAYSDLSGTPGTVGVEIQSYNVALDSLATMGTGANKIIYSTAVDTFAESDITDYTRSLLAEANEGAVKSYLNLEIGTDVQAQNATLQGIAGIGGVADGKIIYTDGGADTFATSDISAFALTILDDATDSDVRTTLGLGTASTKNTDFFLEANDGINALADVLIANVSNAQILIYDSDGGENNNQWKNLTLSGDASLSNDGSLTIGAGAITNAKMDSPFVNLTDGANTDKLNLGETITFAGTANEVEVSTTADANGDVAGATVTVGLPQNVTIGNNLTVTGNLTVSGTTTTVNTTNMEIEDRVISLNTGGNNDKDMGLFFDRGQVDPALFIFDQDVGRFKVGTQNGGTASQDANYALTTIGMEVATPANNSNNTEVATTAWVRTYTGNVASALDDLSDVNLGVTNGDGVALANAQILVYDSDGGDEDTKWKNVSLSGDIAITNAGVASISEGVIVNADINANASIAVSKLASSSVTVGTTEITLGNASTTLSGMTGIDFAVGNASIASSIGNSILTLGGANTTVDVAGVLTVNDPTADTHATTKTYVDTQVATKQDSDATLTALAGLETGAKKLIYSTANDTLEMISLSDKAKTFISSDAGLTNLDGVTIGGVALAEKHFLVQNDAGQFVNRLITTSDLQNGSNIALLDADQTFTGTVLVTTQGAGNNTTRIASTAFVQQEITALDLANTYQGKDATLTALAGVATAANKLIYATDADAFSTTDFTAKARELLDDATFGAMRTTLGLAIGTDVQAYNSDLAGIAGLGGVATGKIIYTKTVDNNVVWDEATFTDYAKDLLTQGNEANIKSYLNLESGIDVQDYDASLQSISALGTDANKLIYTTGVDTFAESNLTAFARTILDDADASAVRTTLGVAIGTNVQAYNLALDNLSAMGTAANKLIYSTGVDTFAESDLTAFARTFLDDADAGSVRTTLGLAIGTNVQAYDASLQSISALGTGANKIVYTTDVDTFAESDLTAFARTILDDADASTVRGTLGLGDSSTLDTTITGGNADAGKVVKTDGDGKIGAIDGANLTALGSIGLHSNVDLTNLAHGQGLVYSTTNGANRFEPGSVPTTGTNVNQTPTISAQSISLNPNALVGGDLLVYGRVMEVIDYGSVADAFDASTDFDIDFGAITDTVIYCEEDYGVLVV